MVSLAQADAPVPGSLCGMFSDSWSGVGGTLGTPAPLHPPPATGADRSCSLGLASDHRCLCLTHPCASKGRVSVPGLGRHPGRELKA